MYASASSINLALNKPATASSTWNSGSLASNAVDGNSRSEWGPANLSEAPWLKIDLGKVTQFRSYAVESWIDRYNGAIKLEVSNDDLTWTEVDVVSGNTDIRIFRTLSQPVSARYVKVTITAWSFFPDITEFELYNDAPAAPTNVTAASGDGEVTLNWSSVSNAASYDVYQGTAPGSYDLTPVASVNETTATLTGLTNGVNYYFTVKSSNQYGSSLFSNEVSATPQIPAPAAPTGLTAAAGNEQVILSWNAVAGAYTFDVYKRNAEDSYDSIPVATVTGSTYTYTVTGLTNGTTYNFVVKASNMGGDSGSSNEVSATPQVPVPGAPVLLPATVSDSKVSLAWNSINGSTGYKVYKSTASGEYGAEEATVTSSTYNYEVTGLTNGTPYYFVVKATNPGGDSAASNEVSATPITYPAAPTNVIAVAGNRQAVVSFDESSENGGIPITRYEVTALPGNITAVGSASPITVEGLTNGITYTFTVKAVNDAGSSTASAASNTVTLSSTTESSPAPQPTPTPTPTPASTPSPTPGSTPVSEPVNHVFNSSLVDEKNLASAIESKIGEANKAGIKNELNDSKGHWAEKTIDTYVKLNFIRGYTNGQFKPNANITRAEFASLISRVFNLNAATGQSANMSDISSHWAKEAIEQLAGAGVLGGYSDGTFRPNQAISREEIVVILSRIVNLNSMNQDDSKGNFTDLSTANSYATQAIKSAAKAGIVSGRNDGEFDPHGNTTRAEALTIIQNALRLNPQIKELLNSLN